MLFFHIHVRMHTGLRSCILKLPAPPGLNRLDLL